MSSTNTNVEGNFENRIRKRNKTDIKVNETKYIRVSSANVILFRELTKTLLYIWKVALCNGENLLLCFDNKKLINPYKSTN